MSAATAPDITRACPHCGWDPATTDGAMHLSLLGGWRLESGGRLVEVQRSVQRLLAFVALRRGCSRDLVAGQLWPECTDARAHGNLRSALWRTHQLPEGLVREQSDGLAIGLAVGIDVEHLVHTARTLLDGQHDNRRESPALMADAARDRLLGGDLLPGWYDDWVLVERERLRQLQLHSLEALARRLAARALYSDAVDVAMAAVAAEPVRESAHRIVIDVHLAEGNFGEALRAYKSLRRILAVELGVEPSLDLTARIAQRPMLAAARAWPPSPRTGK